MPFPQNGEKLNFIAVYRTIMDTKNGIEMNFLRNNQIFRSFGLLLTKQEMMYKEIFQFMEQRETL